MADTCYTCRHLHTVATRSVHRCRRFPPAVGGGYPIVDPSEPCGEHSAISRPFGVDRTKDKATIPIAVTPQPPKAKPRKRAKPRAKK